MTRLRQIGQWAARVLILLASPLLLGGSAALTLNRSDQVRNFTRPVEFDYVSWTGVALAEKLEYSGLRPAEYLSEPERKALVLEYVELIGETARLRAELEVILGDPDSDDPRQAAGPVGLHLEGTRGRVEGLRPLAESVLQENVAAVLADLGLGWGPALFPPVSFRFSSLPSALVVSPRDVIRQEANLQLVPELSLEQQIDLESRVEHGLDVSALVVGIGGLSTYPTMVMETTAMDWVVETIVHEWVHHYLAFRPLGLGYNRSPELRTLNETVAGLVGREIGREVLARYYPEHLPPPPPQHPPPSAPGAPPEFDFQIEMRETRERVDVLLVEGRIEEAESYMEARRRVFWEYGYRHLRRINQAYFAFYGAYADVPGGPAGEDPVGEAVRQLWARVGDPVRFLRQVASMSSFEELRAILES
ncbi:MAG: hypothetical protein ACRDHG_14695 [Anaerolineales bacterium]